MTAPLQPAKLTDADIEATAHRKAWRYEKSSELAHSDTYTFNRSTLVNFARTIIAMNAAQAAPVAAEGDERDQFENWYGKFPFDLVRDPNGDYSHGGPLLQWKAWQARAAISPQAAPVAAIEPVAPTSAFANRNAQLKPSPNLRAALEWLVVPETTEQTNYRAMMASPVTALPDSLLCDAEIDGIDLRAVGYKSESGESWIRAFARVIEAAVLAKQAPLQQAAPVAAITKDTK